MLIKFKKFQIHDFFKKFEFFTTFAYYVLFLLLVANQTSPTVGLLSQGV